jgi:DNA-binding IclR family transcriptional regulator
MPESETQVVFRILGVLAKARDFGHALPVEEIADAAHLARTHAERYMNMLKHAGTVRAEVSTTRAPQYSLTRYGLERLPGRCATATAQPPCRPPDLRLDELPAR